MAEHPWAKQRTFTSLFIGGGTPTIYDGEALAELVSSCLRLYRFIEAPEVTVESNPNMVDGAKLTALKKAGANRLSIGVQSFSDKVLRAIGRAHSADEAKAAIVIAREAGFENLNLDLIYGLPEQGLAEWQESLDEAMHCRPEHLALYELMIEEGTPFAERAARSELNLPSEDIVIQMTAVAQEKLAAHGYGHYEISNFSKPNRQCNHNINYWQNGSYLGIGAAAVSCLSGVRIKNVVETDKYLRLINEGKEPYLEAECLPLEARFRETVIMGMRMCRGVSNKSLIQRFGLTPQQYYGTTIESLLEYGLIEIKEDYLRLTKNARPIANQVLARLV